MAIVGYDFSQKNFNVTLSQAESNGDVMNGSDMLKRSNDTAAMVPYWDLTDTIVDGIDALRQAETKYLPKFESEDDDTYKMRLSLTKFTNVYRDIIETLTSKPFEEEITLVDDDETTPPDEIAELAEDVDGEGSTLTEFGNQVFFNGINSAIHWIMVDYPNNDDPLKKPKTRAQQKAAGMRPYWSHVIGRNVLSVKTKKIGGKTHFTYMKILEPQSEGYDGSVADHVRIFKRDEFGVVTWELWRKVHHDAQTVHQKFVRVEFGTLSISIIPLVPFITGRREGRTFKILPAMQDAADLSRELYLQESGLKYAKTVSAYSMLVGKGVKPEKKGDKIVPLNIGPMKVLYAPPNAQGQNGEWGFIQPDPAVLSFLKDDIKETIQDLRELGKQPLTAQSGNLTVITTAVAAGKAKSAVGAWAFGLQNALENALIISMLWLGQKPGENYDPAVDVYTEFDDVLDDGKDLDALGSARDRGDLSRKTYWGELKRRRVLSPDFDPDKETEALLKETPGEDGGEFDNPPPDDPAIEPGKVQPNPQPEKE